MTICRIAGDPRPPRGAQVGGLDRVVLLCRAHGLPLPETEQRFHPTRRWRADYLWRGARVILEIDGGIYRGGRGGGLAIGGHSSAAGIRRDMAKANQAQLCGFVFLRATPDDISSGVVLDLLARAFRLPGIHQRYESEATR
jgi:hypothetical protein